MFKGRSYLNLPKQSHNIISIPFTIFSSIAHHPFAAMQLIATPSIWYCPLSALANRNPHIHKAYQYHDSLRVTQTLRRKLSILQQNTTPSLYIYVYINCRSFDCSRAKTNIINALSESCDENKGFSAVLSNFLDNRNEFYGRMAIECGGAQPDLLVVVTTSIDFPLSGSKIVGKFGRHTKCGPPISEVAQCPALNYQNGIVR